MPKASKKSAGAAGRWQNRVARSAGRADLHTPSVSAASSSCLLPIRVLRPSNRICGFGIKRTMPPSGRSVLIVIHLQETSRFRLPNLAPCAKLERLWYSECLHDPGKRSDRGNFIQGTLRRESIGVVADGHH